MKKPPNLKGGTILLVLLTLLFWSSCVDPKPPAGDDTYISGSEMLAADSVRQFYHAWLADCVNGLIKDTSYWVSGYDPTEELRTAAHAAITNAAASDSIAPVVGAETLAWGPELVIDYDGGDGYIAKNLMYCLKSTDVDNNTIYNVGIAGTNSISHYDWFTEDLQANTQVAWPPGGVISMGTQIGIQELDGLQSRGQSLFAFLHQATSNDAAIIKVAGHSLGGALTQAYSSYLKSVLPTTAKVEAWVYAGPTAGDKVFADSLTNQLDGYYAFNNTRDAVPHAWQADSLAQLCGIYNGLNICDSLIQDNVAVNGLMKFLSMVGAQAPAPYHIPGTPSTFTGAPAVVSKCGDFVDGVYAIWKSGDVNDVYLRMNAISQQCGNGDISEPGFYGFFFYLAEMGLQHTTAYFDHFITPQGKDFAAAVNGYSSSSEGSITEGDNLDQAKLLIEDVLFMAKDSLITNNITDCGCS